MNFRAAIFDLDGTLLNTLADIRGALNHTLRENGYPERDLEFTRLAVGSGMRELIKKALPPETSPEVLAGCVAQMREYYLTHWNVETCVYDGIYDVLQYLADSAVSLNVLSNKPDPITQAMIPHWFGKFKFTSVIGAREGDPLKPDPTVALAIARAADAAPEQVLFIGDSPQDIITAKNAGMVSIGVLWGYRTERELAEAGADLLAKDPQTMLTLLRERLT